MIYLATLLFLATAPVHADDKPRCDQLSDDKKLTTPCVTSKNISDLMKQALAQPNSNGTQLEETTTAGKSSLLTDAMTKAGGQQIGQVATPMAQATGNVLSNALADPGIVSQTWTTTVDPNVITDAMAKSSLETISGGVATPLTNAVGSTVKAAVNDP